MKSPPKVAVILINRDHFDLTEACVESLVATKYPNLLIVVTDNGSKQSDLDKLAALAKKHPSVLVHPLGYNAGFTKANNAGIRAGQAQDAEYFWILNNDTEVREDAVELSLKAFEEHRLDPANSVVSSIITYADSDKIWCNGMRDLAWANFPKSVDKLRPASEVAQPGIVLKQAAYTVGCSMFFSKAFLQAHGLMNEEYFIYYDDLDYTLGCNNVCIQQPLVRHKVSSTSGFKGSGRYTPFQSFLFAKNGIHFYFRKKKIPWYEKIIFLSFTAWVFVLLYVRDYATMVAYLKGLREGLAGVPGGTPGPAGKPEHKT
jgi:GT2 family glycosyltransferase